MKLEIEAASVQELAVALNTVLSKLLIEDEYLKNYREGDKVLPYETDIGAAHCNLELTGDEFTDVWAQHVVMSRALQRVNRALDPEDMRSPMEEVEDTPEAKKFYKVKQLKESFDLSGDRRTLQDALIDNLALNF
ncbi:hypothetical protein H6F88_31620 [Oculatella sp. FACHB-28]|uniref:hypothetical protein n=1 Tax=Oculatella sp. FACHB-28 TaxID=2692845 RepID=UPI001682AA98|nr:hypothetical protein [Oculatella sp. FACHB-28]MBD2060492.1 hypothetical protein [Oculatella sp. FACHB-28]